MAYLSPRVAPGRWGLVFNFPRRVRRLSLSSTTFNDSSRSVRVGDSVFTIGFPAMNLLGEEAKFTDGSVSALSGPEGESSLMQITVPVQPGNSGGPLLNIEGHVVGVVTSSAAVSTFLKATGALPQNVNWAVKSEYAVPLIEEPPLQPKARDRREAVDRAVAATCRIETIR